MCPITLDSTSDSKEAVTAALGDLAKLTQVESKPEEPSAEVKAQSAETEASTESQTSEVEESSGTEETEEAEELEAKPEDENQEAKPAKKKGGFQKRIDKLNKKALDLEQEKEYWRQQALRTQKPNETDLGSSQKPDLSKRPKAEDFESHDQYVEALTDWKLDQKLSAEKQKQAENAVKTEVQTKLASHQSRVAKFTESHDDFDDIIESVSDIPLTLAVQESLVDSEYGPELMYELAKNPKELKRICSLTPIAAAKEIGKLESRFLKDTSTPSEKKTITKPAPVTPVRSRGASNVKDIYKAEELSQREWNKLREEQIRSARR